MAAAPAGILANAAALLRASGLILRGGFNFDDGEAAPAGPDGAPALSVLLVGQAGARAVAAFPAWRAAARRGSKIRSTPGRAR